MNPTPHKPPLIGLLGGIASGKSFYSRAFASRGCLVIDADQLVADLYRRSDVLATFERWWGGEVLAAGRTLNRAAVARIIFSDPGQRRRLEAYVHPLVRAERDARTAAARASANPPPAIVWDTPLLVEIGQQGLCDLLVFIDTPDPVREARAQARGWPLGELARRESQQAPLAQKRSLAHVVVSGIAGEPEAITAVDDVLARLTVG